MSKISISELYTDCEQQRKRYKKLQEAFNEFFGVCPERYFSASGRTEVCGNHTDHNHGMVMAAAVNLDIIAAAKPRDDGKVTVKSEGYEPDCINIDDISAKPEEKNSSAALIRGVCAGLKARGYNIGGLDAYTVSDVLKGSGLSSSAAFEVLIGTVINHLYNGGKIPSVEIAQICLLYTSDAADEL